LINLIFKFQFNLITDGNDDADVPLQTLPSRARVKPVSQLQA